MASLIIVTRDGTERRIDAQVGLSVMENIRDSGIDELQALCGGSCSCATCHVYVDQASATGMPESNPDESDLLAASEMRRDNSRLSCQLQFSAAMDGLRVTIAPED
jgi:2Fe-2S ferredoxin